MENGSMHPRKNINCSMLLECNELNRALRLEMMVVQVKVALCQLLTTDNKEKNISTAQQAIKVRLYGSSPGHAGQLLECMILSLIVESRRSTRMCMASF